MKKAFSLVEMCVVIGIIGILMAVLIGSFSGSTESARSVRCLSNLHNLGGAWGVSGCSAGSYLGMPPFQGLHQVTDDEDKQLVYEVHGWISWYSQGKLPYLMKDNNPSFKVYATDNVQSPDWFVSTYSKDEKARTYCLTNGALWRAVGSNRNVYVCPTHLSLSTDGKCNKPCWSYVMNGIFDITIGAPIEEGELPQSGGVNLTYKVGSLALLFCELPFREQGFQKPDYGESPGTVNDAILESPDCSPDYKGDTEAIGFNHRSGNRYVAHICYADGHTEKLTMPKKMTLTQAKELTKLLANGRDFSFNGQKYEEVK